MANTGIPLDYDWRQLFLLPGGDPTYPSHWRMVIEEREAHPVSFIIRGDQEPKELIRQVRSQLYNLCSSSWLDEEFAETEALITALVEEVQNFERLILNSQLSEVQVKDAFLDITKTLKVQIQTSIFQLLRTRRPAAAELVVNSFKVLDLYEIPQWATPIE